MGSQSTSMFRKSHWDLFLSLELCRWRRHAVTAHTRYALPNEDEAQGHSPSWIIATLGADALFVTLEQWRNEKDSNGLMQTLHVLKRSASKCLIYIVSWHFKNLYICTIIAYILHEKFITFVSFYHYKELFVEWNDLMDVKGNQRCQ